MGEAPFDRRFGRQAFGGDPAGYHDARPPYPEWVFTLLRERCGLRPGTATFEIGPGPGTATRRLLELGANPLVAVEPDERSAAFLRNTLPDEGLTVIVSTFEDAALDESSFDLGFSGTAMHWIDEELALTRVASLLRPGGWWVAVWNVFEDQARADPFHEATKTLLAGPVHPSIGKNDIPFPLETDARLAALERTGAFGDIAHETSAWSLVLDADQTAALYATYSIVTIRPDRDAVLAELHRIARDAFGGRVTRNMITRLYLARRRG